MKYVRVVQDVASGDIVFAFLPSEQNQLTPEDREKIEEKVLECGSHLPRYLQDPDCFYEGNPRVDWEGDDIIVLYCNYYGEDHRVPYRIRHIPIIDS